MAHLVSFIPIEAVLLSGGSEWMPNGRLIGDRVLPEGIASRRRQLRGRLQELREPIRSRRQELVPGPDVIGRVESTVVDLRDRFTARDGLLARIRQQREGGEQQTDQQQNEEQRV